VSDRPHIIIIGAGLIGLSTADALESRGASVTVIEARPGPCEGTSFSNSGMVHPSQSRSWGGSHLGAYGLDAARVTAELGKVSAKLLKDQIKRLGLHDLGIGCLKLYGDIETTRAAQLGYNKIGVKSNILIDPIDTFGITACHFPDDAFGDSRVFGCVLERDLNLRSVRFIYNAAGLNIRRREGGFSIQVSSAQASSTKTSADTSLADEAEETLHADHVVIAAGIQSVDVLAKLGLRMQLEAISGAAADYALPKEQEDLPSCPVMDSYSRSALTVFKDRVRISGGVGLKTPDVLIERWRDIAPGLMMRLGNPISKWTGRRVAGSDDLRKSKRHAIRFFRLGQSQAKPISN